MCQHRKGTMLDLSNRLNDLIARTEHDFAGISETQASAPAIQGGWSRKEILGHLIDSASNNHQRFVRAQLQDELRWPSYDQSGCVRVQRFQDARWSDLLGFWAAYNRFLAHVLAGVPAEKRSIPCWIGNYPLMTLEELAADYLTHLEHHLDQIRVKT
jgi:hypothetical protein